MVIVGALATPTYIEVSANRTLTPHDFRILPVHVYSYNSSFVHRVIFKGKIASHSASTVVMVVFSESDILQAASEVCKKLLQFSSDQTEGAEARLHRYFGLWTGAEHALHMKTLLLDVSSPSFRDVTGCHLCNAVDDTTFHTFHTNSETR